jgi:glycosyltransferase involved in cell wall biosynthesis
MDGGPFLMDRKVKILFMSPDLPYPVVGGGRMRAESIIRGLSRYAEVHIACIAPGLPESTGKWARETGVDIRIMAEPPAGFVQRCWERGKMVATWCNLRYRRREDVFFREALSTCRPDAVWLETPYLLRYAIPWQGQVPLIVDYWGTSEGHDRLFRAATGFSKAVKWLQWDIARRTEERFARRIRHIVTVSELDGRYFRRISPRAHVWAVPIGARTLSRPEIQRFSEPDSPSMIFTGDLSYAPNVDAAIFFAREIFPAIRARVTEATVRFVGRNPLPEVLALAGIPGVQVEGFVPDLMEVIREASLYILPMRLGSGIRSKLFEVFPLGKPIVTTTIGAEGLELHDGVNCLMADSAGAFSEACVRLLGDRQERERLGGAVRDLAFNTYSQGNVVDILRRILQEMGLLEPQREDRFPGEAHVHVSRTPAG